MLLSVNSYFVSWQGCSLPRWPGLLTPWSVFPGVQVPVKSNDVLGVTKIRDIVNLDVHYEES